MPSRRLTPGGSFPPSCKYLCTASRPVKSTPEISTDSPTFNERIFSSVIGVLSWITESSLIEPLFNLPAGFQQHALPPKSPAHIADADEIGSRQPVGRANLHA